ncbi:hypothetical protein ACJX0J_018468, partial [Zea mays]
IALIHRYIHSIDVIYHAVALFWYCTFSFFLFLKDLSLFFATICDICEHKLLVACFPTTASKLIYFYMTMALMPINSFLLKILRGGIIYVYLMMDKTYLKCTFIL